MTLMQVVIAAFAQCGPGIYGSIHGNACYVVVPVKAGTQRLERTLKSLGPGFAGATNR